jgi:hypothetical protein
LEKHHEAHQQEKTKEREQRTKGCVHDRQRYANTHSENTKARIEQVTSNHELKSITTCKESFAIVNPTFIAIELEVRTSTLNVRQGETQTLPDHRNREFLANQRKTLSKLLVFDIIWKTYSTS